MTVAVLCTHRDTTFISVLFPSISKYLDRVGLGIIDPDAMKFFSDVVDQSITARQDGSDEVGLQKHSSQKV